MDKIVMKVDTVKVHDGLWHPMTSYEASGIIKKQIECLERKEECDRDCLRCDLLCCRDDIKAAYELAVRGLDSVIWVRESDTAAEVAKALYEAIVVTGGGFRHLFTHDELREIADYLYEWTGGDDLK